MASIVVAIALGGLLESTAGAAAPATERTTAPAVTAEDHAQNGRNDAARGVRYPAAMLLPLVLFAAGLFLARTFTRDVTPTLPTRIGRIQLNRLVDDETMTEEPDI